MSLRRLRPFVVLAALVGAGLSCSDATGPLDRPGPPAEVTVSRGDDQTGTAGSVATDSLVLVVKDEDGRPVRGVVVSFAVTQGGGTVSAAQDTTDSNGRVAVRWTLGPAAGEQRVTATITGIGTPVVFDAEVEPAAPAAVTAHAGATQNGTVGALAPDTLVARVTDQFGNPIGGVVVTWAASAGATLTPVTSTTDAAGLVKARLAAGTTVGSYTATATVAGIATPATFTLVAAAGAPASVTVAGGGQTGALGAALADSLVARVLDQHGNPVPGVAVTFAATHGGALSPATGQTDATGRLATRWTLGNAPGQQTATITVAGLTPATVTATATVPAGATLAKTAGDGGEQTVFSQRALTVRAQTAGGQPIPGITLTWSVAGPETQPATRNATLSQASSVTDAQGNASATLRLSAKTGANTVTVSGAGFTPVTFTVTGTADQWCTVNIGGDLARTGVVGQPLAGTWFAISLDRWGNPTTGGTVGFEPRAGSIGQNAQGQPVWILGTVAGQQTALVRTQMCETVGGDLGPATTRAMFSEFVATAVPGAAAQIAAGAGNGATAGVGTNLPVTAIVSDQYGNAVSGATVSWAVSSGGGAVAPATSTSNGSGAASATWTLGATAGSQTLVATLAATGATASFNATATAGQGAALTILSGNAQADTIEATLRDSLVVRVTDANGNAVQGAAVTFTPGANSGSVSATTVLTNALGRAAVRWTLGSVLGAQTMVASSGALAPATFTATARNGFAVTIEKMSGDNQTGPAGQPLPDSLVVRLRDRRGNPVPGSMVVWTPDEFGGTVTSASPLTDSNGLSRVQWTITAGPHAVSATAGSAGNVVFTGTGTVGTAAIVKISGDTVVQAHRYTGVTVEVRDANGQPVPGVTLNWSVEGPAPSGGMPGATMESPTTTTNAQGRATATVLLSTKVGMHTLTASANGYPTTSFPIRGIARPFCQAQAGPVSSSIALGDSVMVTARSFDPYGNPAGGFFAPFVSTDSTGYDEGWWKPTTVGTHTLQYTFYICNGTSLVGEYFARGQTGFYSVTVTPPATQAVALQRISPSTDTSVVAGAGVTLVARAVNSQGQPIAGVPVSFAVASGAGTFSAAADTSDAAGHASVTFTTSTTPGTHDVTASSPGLSSASFRIFGTQPSTARFASSLGGNGQSAAATSWLPTPLTVRVVDANGSALAGQQVAWTVAGGGELASVVTTTDQEGRATARWRLGTGAPQSVTVSLPGNPSAATANFTATALEFASVSAGVLHSCGLLADGQVYCWGDNSSGQVGKPGGGSEWWPHRIATNLRFKQVAPASNYTCALTLEGQAWCWGANELGHLGTGDNTSSSAPRQVAGGHLFSSISGRFNHTCALRASDGAAFCWGSDNVGQLGRGFISGTCTTFSGPFHCANQPVAVTGARSFASISAGGADVDGLTCAIDTTGKAWCWGSDSKGALGGGAVRGNSSQPRAVASDLSFTAINVENRGACAIAAGGAAWCWGLNDAGQLGVGTIDNSDHPTPGAVPGLTFRELSRASSAVCGLATDKQAWCWGSNTVGMLGTDDVPSSASPAPVEGGLTFERLHTGTSTACAVTSTGAAYCWGYNSNGQIGDGGINTRFVPTRVAYQATP